jgi:deazaflavin-dependent oxidoreductase (nitroreductase family)
MKTARVQPRRPLHVLRRLNKWILNPAMRILAGGRYWFAATIEHVGRRSGRTYVTPVLAQRTPTGFVGPLPYGADTDWLQNVLAAGRCTVHWHGDAPLCGDPTVLATTDLAGLLPGWLVRLWKVVGIRQGLRVTRLGPEQAKSALPGGVASHTKAPGEGPAFPRS